MTLPNGPAADGRWIAGIYNYCDRWCERCPLTSRCRLFARTEATGPPVTADEALADVGTHLLEAMEMIRDRAVEHGLDPSAPSDPADIQKERACDEVARQHPLLVAAGEYAGMAGAWLAANAPEYRPARLAPAADASAPSESKDFGEVICVGEGPQMPPGEAIQIIEWHRFQIAGKLSRALRSCEPVDAGSGDASVQTDTNGSAKVALLAVEQTLDAWFELMHLGRNTAGIVNIVMCLSALRDGLESAFPAARRFARPGFDTGDRPWPVLR